MTRQRMDAVVAGVRGGLTRSAAARLVGLAPSTVGRWVEMNIRFGDDLAQAEAECQSELLSVVRDVAGKRFPNTWQAAAWLLERRWPDIYGQKTRLDISLETDEFLREMASKFGMTPEEVQAMAEALITAKAPGTHES